VGEEVRKGAARRARAAVRHLQADVSLSGDYLPYGLDRARFDLARSDAQAGPVTPSPLSVAGSAVSTRRRAAANMHGVAEPRSELRPPAFLAMP
jgi:hypothetical protein